ncbi:MAG: hypothetical protein U5L95_00390 [Candidatus Saccharibacteria bacterium]|nr:hypothetical protein [Candidatus Saccharibacteria bacterium]
MNEVRSLTEQFSDSANEFWTAIGDYLPKLFGALLLIIAALIVAKIAQSIIERTLKLLRVDKLAKNKQVKKTLKSAELNIDFVGVAGRATFWVVIIIFALTIADVLGLTAMSDVIRELLNYLPSVIAGAIVLTVTFAGARLVRDAVVATLKHMRVDFASTVGSVVFYVLVIFGSIMALDQLGFDTTILAANITVIVAGIVFALALAFGLGGRDTAKKVVDESYDNYKKAIHKK